MTSVRIRTPFAVAFAALVLIAAYLGLSTQKIPSYGQSDKGLHFITFFLLTLTFYWIIETSRRRVVHLTLVVCTVGLSVGSEVAQGFLDNGRDFDPYDILANVVGSGLALGLSQWYHKRMLERKRKNKHYDIIPGEEVDDDAGVDLELGVGAGLSGQESGTIPVEASNGQTQAEIKRGTNVSEELDNWDENEEDWDADGADGEEQQSSGEGEAKKRAN